MPQIEFDFLAVDVEHRNADGRLQDGLVEPVHLVKQRHVQLKTKPVKPHVLWNDCSIHLHTLGNGSLRLKHEHVVAAKGQIQEVPSIAVHLHLVEGLAGLKHPHRGVDEGGLGLLVLQTAHHLQACVLAPRRGHSEHPASGNQQPALAEATEQRPNGAQMREFLHVGLHHGRQAEK